MSNRSCFTNRWLPLVCTVLGLSAGGAQGNVVYDNTTNPTGEDVPPVEVGSEITLGGGPRYLSKLVVPVRPGGDSDATFTLGLGIRANDGGDFGQGPVPGTLLWNSTIERTIKAGVTTFIEFDLPAVKVPERFTWILYKSGDSIRVVQYYPPSVGSARFGLWAPKKGPFAPWDFHDQFAPFGALMFARGVPTVSSWGLGVLTLSFLISATVVMRHRNRAVHCFLAAFAALAITASGRAQVQIGDPTRIDVNGTTAAANETSIAATGAAPFEIVAAWGELVALDPDHAEGHTRLAIGLYYLHDYEEAWAHVHAAEDLGRRVPPQFRALLEERYPEP